MDDRVVDGPSAERWAARLPSIRIDRLGSGLILFVLAAAAVGAAVALGSPTYGGDLRAYWEAAHRLGAGGSVYLPQELAGPFPPWVQLGYFYPPPLAIAVAGVQATGLSFDAFRAGWSAISAGGIAVAAILGMRAGGAARLALPVLGVIVAAPLWWHPERGLLLNGNASGILALAMATAIVPGTVGGVGTALATLVKLTPGAVAPGVLARRGRGAVALLATLAMGVLVSYAVAPGDTLATPRVLANLSAGGTGGLYDYGPAATLAVFFGSSGAVVGRIAGLLAMAALIGWSIVAARDGRRRTAVVAGTWATLLVSGTLWEHYLVVVALPVGLAWPGASRSERLLIVASLAAGWLSFLPEVTGHLLIWEWALALAIVSLRAAVRLDRDAVQGRSLPLHQPAGDAAPAGP
jgi:hypothetical protein